MQDCQVTKIKVGLACRCDGVRLDACLKAALAYPSRQLMLIEFYEDEELLRLSREVISIELLMQLFLSFLLFACSGALFGLLAQALLDRDAFEEESVIEDWDLGYVFHLWLNKLDISHLFLTD